MQRRFRVRETSCAVELRPTEGGFTARTEAGERQLAPRLLGQREIVWSENGQTKRFWVARLPDGSLWVSAQGRAHRFLPEEEKRRRGADAHSSLSSPMPGKLVRVVKGVGESVLKGETLLVVEAMKMELPIKAPRDGVIKSIHAEVGEKVAPNTPLLALE